MGEWRPLLHCHLGNQESLGDSFIECCQKKAMTSGQNDEMSDIKQTSHHGKSVSICRTVPVVSGFWPDSWSDLTVGSLLLLSPYESTSETFRRAGP